jgi:ferritin-like metal-binding protein YciE
MEYFEIACYQALAVAADTAGLPHIVNACKQIIADEDKMAEFISEQLPRAVRNYIGQMTMARAA